MRSCIRIRRMKAASEYAHTLQVGPFLQDLATFYIDIDAFSGEKGFILAAPSQGGIVAGSEAGLFRSETGERWIEIRDKDANSLLTRVLRAAPNGSLWISNGARLARMSPDGRV